MKNIYKVIQPVILLQIAAESSIIILLSIITIMVKYYFSLHKHVFTYNIFFIFQNYFNGLSLASPSNFRFITTILIFLVIIYLVFYVIL